MKIRCPNCGRIGYLPDHLAPAANSLRCRKCLANFAMPEFTLEGREAHRKEIDSWRGATVERPVAVRSRENPALFLADGFVASFDEPDGSLRKRGPGESHYELTFALKDEPRSSGNEWMAADTVVLEPEAPSSDQVEAIVATGTGLSHWLTPTLGDLMSWLRPLVCISLGFIALSVLLIGFLIVRSLELGGGPVLPMGTHALVLASLGTVSLLVFGLWFVVLIVVLADVAQNLRRLGETMTRGRER